MDNQLKQLDEDLTKKLAALPDTLQKQLGDTFVDAKDKSLGDLKDQIVKL
jgi:hypothetical protein